MRDELIFQIGRTMVGRDSSSQRLYALEEEGYRTIHEAAQELTTKLRPEAFLNEEECKIFGMAEELCALLDYFRPASIYAATAFLQRYGKVVKDKSPIPND